MASRPTAISFATKLLTPKNVHFLQVLIDADLGRAMELRDVERTAELIELKKYADTLVPKADTE